MIACFVLCALSLCEGKACWSIESHQHFHERATFGSAFSVKHFVWVKHTCVSEQGTAATAVAGVYGALAVQGKEFKELTKQRIVLVGAGSAGMGVARMLALGMVKQVSKQHML